MADRAELIARKQTLRRRIERMNAELAHLRNRTPLPARKIRRLEDDVERLMGEEYALRQAIDRSAHAG